MRPDAAETPRSKATSVGTPVPPARFGKETAKKLSKTCVTPAFVIVLEIRVSDVPYERAEVISLPLLPPQGWLLLGARQGCAGQASLGRPSAKLGWREGLPEVSWAVSAGSVGLVDARIPSLSRREMFVLKPARSQAAAPAYFMRGLQIPRWRVV